MEKPAAMENQNVVVFFEKNLRILKRELMDKFKKSSLLAKLSAPVFYPHWPNTAHLSIRPYPKYTGRIRDISVLYLRVLLHASCQEEIRKKKRSEYDAINEMFAKNEISIFIGRY